MKNKAFIIFIVLSIYASALNYFSYPVLSRVLPSTEFVSMTIAISLMTQMSTLLSSIVAITTGLSRTKKKKSKNNIEVLQSSLVYLLATVYVIFCLFAPLFFDSIGLELAYLAPIGLMLVFSIPISTISGFFNGKQMLMKLGSVAAISASLQFLLGVGIGLLTSNGVFTVLAMSAGQILSVLLLYLVYKSDSLPHMGAIITHTRSDFLHPAIKKIVIFTIYSSLGVLLINILQIADLLLIQRVNPAEREYVDIYIISRAVFFAGTIFVWPFIGTVRPNDRAFNFQRFKKLLLILSGLTLLAVALTVSFGREIVELLLGVSYQQSVFSGIAVLSILYKFFYVVLFAFILYFIVMLDRLSFYIPVVLSAITYAFYYLVGNDASTTKLLGGLTLIAVIGVFACSLLAYARSPRKDNS